MHEGDTRVRPGDLAGRAAAPPSATLVPPAAGSPTPDPPAPVTTPTPDAPDGAVPFRLGYRPALDGVRGVAVAMVLLYHVGEMLWVPGPTWALRGGFLGVDVFFALSGFLITVLVLGEVERRGGVSLRSFGVRRARRLVPLLVAVLAALLALSLAGTMYSTDDVLVTSLVTLTFTQNWLVGHVDGLQAGHLWSVALEAQFYVVWAVTVVLAARTRRPHAVLAGIAGAGIVAVVAWRAYLWAEGTSMLFLYCRTATRLDAPLMGALAGIVASAGWLGWLRGRAAAVAGVAGLTVAVCAAALLEFTDVVLYRGLFTVVALCAAVAVLAVVREPAGPLLRVLSLRPLVALGLVSYSVYVWHFPVFEIVATNASGQAPALRVVLAVAITLVVAALSYRFIERPFLRSRRGPRRQPGSPNAKQRSARAPKAYTS
jgi:peptidoglycan/LPS O-acetylase OafA/YrhL